MWEKAKTIKSKKLVKSGFLLQIILNQFFNFFIGKAVNFTFGVDG